MSEPETRGAMQPDARAPKKFLTRMDSHHRVLIAGAAAAVTFLLLLPEVPLPLQLTLTWSVFAVVLLSLAWVVILTGKPAEIRLAATLQDAGVTVIFAVVLAGALGSLTAVVVLLGTTRGLHGTLFVSYALIAVMAVSLSWLLVHTMFALHYAHIYHGSVGTGDHGVSLHGGLVFPGGHEPDFMDFAYFSFVIGMTCQVSDVAVASRSLRRLTLVHGVIAFVFNTVILALTINMVAGITIP
jgi:uncharacterized membrane protein